MWLEYFKATMCLYVSVDVGSSFINSIFIRIVKSVNSKILSIRFRDLKSVCVGNFVVKWMKMTCEYEWKCSAIYESVFIEAS